MIGTPVGKYRLILTQVDITRRPDHDPTTPEGPGPLVLLKLDIRILDLRRHYEATTKPLRSHYEALRRHYEALRRLYEALRRLYEALRSFTKLGGALGGPGGALGGPGGAWGVLGPGPGPGPGPYFPGLGFFKNLVFYGVFGFLQGKFFGSWKPISFRGAALALVAPVATRHPCY